MTTEITSSINTVPALPPLARWDLAVLQSSVVDLAEKCTQLRIHKTQLRDRKRAGEQAPTILWNDGKQVGLESIEEKKRFRRQCSRLHNLAYAFARNVAYRRLEAKCEVPPYVGDIVDILLKVNVEASRPDRACLVNEVRVWLTAVMAS